MKSQWCKQKHLVGWSSTEVWSAGERMRGRCKNRPEIRGSAFFAAELRGERWHFFWSKSVWVTCWMKRWSSDIYTWIRLMFTSLEMWFQGTQCWPKQGTLIWIFMCCKRVKCKLATHTPTVASRKSREDRNQTCTVDRVDFSLGASRKIVETNGLCCWNRSRIITELSWPKVWVLSWFIGNIPREQRNNNKYEIKKDAFLYAWNVIR